MFTNLQGDYCASLKFRQVLPLACKRRSIYIYKTEGVLFSEIGQRLLILKCILIGSTLYTDR